MTTKGQTVAGTKIYISNALPATYDSTGFVALSYTEVGEVTDIGTFGKDYTLVTHNPVGDRKTYKFRGTYNNGSLALKMAKATLANTDAGQVIAATVAGADTSASFKITAQDSSDSFFTGKIMSIMTAVGGPNSMLGSEIKIEIDSDIVETT